MSDDESMLNANMANTCLAQQEVLLLTFLPGQIEVRRIGLGGARKLFQ